MNRGLDCQEGEKKALARERPAPVLRLLVDVVCVCDNVLILPFTKFCSVLNT